MHINTLIDAKNYIESLIIKPTAPSYDIKLARMAKLLDLLGNPQNAYPTIHIGGTSGKTSTATITAAMLQTAGYKTGLHISPHLEDMRERMQINLTIMGEDEFIRRVNTLTPFVEQLTHTEYGPPSYFEFLLAQTFQYFKDEKVAIAVIEVGLGGTLDGTNVITPLVSILTNVGLDHTEILGDTVEKIASDKVGIFKPKVPVISGVTQPSVREIVMEKAAALACPLWLIDQDFSYYRQPKPAQTDLIITYKDSKSFTLEVDSTLPPYQMQNAALAAVALDVIRPNGFDVPTSAMSSTLKAFTVPGRFEIFQKAPIVILDGAHNPDKVNALFSSLEQTFPDQKIQFVFGVKNDKDKKTMIETLSPIAKHFYFTQFFQTTDFGKAQAIEPETLPSLTNVPSTVYQTPKDALAAALNNSRHTDIICVTGSLYLVGELRPIVKKL